ncbi:hypothetical protein L1987_02380 [Smallanthus sonchifolius]|uniref:Uncharacterized protein n=1 Tax=Smallanthus sonchifolius TaxID=185202 RepID=A0ACB9K7P8_9ASTR|nr:hypothetical protein L1987_02380 [Smallanthus sonchifolius]
MLWKPVNVTPRVSTKAGCDTPPPPKRQETTRSYTAGQAENKQRKAYTRNLPKCSRCNFHYNGTCEEARGCAFVIGAGEAKQNPDTVTGTFLLNNHYASMLFDTGAERSFVSSEFSLLLGVEPTVLDNEYTIELADGKLIKTNHLIPICVLELANHSFEIDLLPVKLGSFDVIIGMDWMSKNGAEIVCREKIVRFPLPNGETLAVQGEKSGIPLNIISCMKARKYLRKGYQAILALVTENQTEERKAEDIPVVCDFPEVFPEDLPGLPPRRQVGFRIDLTPGATPIALSQYRLAPSEMQEL